jgi:hypothetical protein
MQAVRIDVQDRDGAWFEGVLAYLDRELDRYFLPRESAERLGEYDPETGNYVLLDGLVEAQADVIEVDGRVVPGWSLATTQLLVRPVRA